MPAWLEGMGDQFSPAMAEAIAAQTAPNHPHKQRRNER
jgi:hypothetical protein